MPPEHAARQAVCRLAGEAAQVPAARRFVTGLLGDTWPDAGDVGLLTGELAANAVLHSASGRPGGKFTVRAIVMPHGYVLVEVEDEGGPWARVNGSGGGESGRGLDIVSAIASEWGRAGGPDTGWIVWARLDWPGLAGPACGRCYRPGGPSGREWW